MNWFLTLILLSLSNVWGKELKIPQLTSPVMDLAGLLSQSEKSSLSSLAYEIHTNQGPQIAILTVPNMQGYPIEDFSIRVAEKWQLGSKEKDNGLLIVIAKEERQMRIEVGNGIEGEITDYDTSKYTRELFPEYFKKNDFHGGLRLFMEDVANRFDVKVGGSGPGLITRRQNVTPHNLPIPPAILLLLFGIIFILHNVLRKKPLLRGVLTSGIFGLTGFFLIGLASVLLVPMIIGFILGIFGINNFLYALAASRGGRMGGGGFGGGGFGGGGGGFSGGGSSGRW